MVREGKYYRSKRDIKAGFIGLLQEKDFEKITIQNIIQEAEYSKTTFYVHFLDKDDLAEQIIKDEITYLTLTAAEYQKGVSFSDTPDQVRRNLEGYFKDVFMHFYQMKDLYTVIKDGRYPGMTLFIFARRLKEESQKTFEVDAGPMNVDLFMQLDCITLMAILEWWIEEDWKHSPDYMSDQASMIHASSHLHASVSDKGMVK